MTVSEIRLEIITGQNMTVYQVSLVESMKRINITLSFMLSEILRTAKCY